MKYLKNIIPRKLIELIFRNTSIKKNLVFGIGKFKLFLTADSQLKYLLGNFDTELLKVVDRYVHQDYTIFDIGANCGVFGFASLLRNSQRVYFFEPDLFLCSLIDKSISINNLHEKASIIPAALSNDVRDEIFDIAARGRASNSLSSLGRGQKGGIRCQKTLVTLKLDNFCAIGNHNTFLKIDVEGAEHNLLLGGQKFIQKFKPIIFIETSTRTFDDVKENLINLGYDCEIIFSNNYLFRPI